MKTLVVDDDRTLADVVAYSLRRAGYEVILSDNGEDALIQWAREDPDLIILDINLPILDGFTVCRRIRKQANTPIIMLTVRSDDHDIVRSLGYGADDYITKPFSPSQLIARVQAVLRRARRSPPALSRQIGKMHLDLNKRELTIGQGDPIRLTPLELRLLDCLMIYTDQSVSSEVISDYVWASKGNDNEALRQLVHRLRKKIEPDLSNPIFLETTPSMGYSLCNGLQKPDTTQKVRVDLD
ncbi:MAG: response regulator transcription factor [Anaerolineaceae bacterium]|nr:response regulator transcription factor [Anaerolineaceae bacterium]